MDRDPFLVRRAHELFEEAFAFHMKEEIEKAILLYRQSIRLHPTAEAHCQLGWAYSTQDRLDLAIRECVNSISIDSDYGNPYNDIGSYLVSLGKYEEAVVWFERAKRARNYESKHFPYMNLGRIYRARGLKLRAIQEFEKALILRPGEPSCIEAIAELKKSIAS